LLVLGTHRISLISMSKRFCGCGVAKCTALVVTGGESAGPCWGGVVGRRGEGRCWISAELACSWEVLEADGACIQHWLSVRALVSVNKQILRISACWVFVQRWLGLLGLRRHSL
jgi:hypothetical protein